MECSKIDCENGLGILLPPRIDSSNSQVVDNEIALLAGDKPIHLIFDAKDLNYISSAGLRVILKYRKLDDKLEIINVSLNVYEVFNMTGFCEMMNISKAYKQMCVDGCEIIGKGAKGTVYRYNKDTVVKVYNDRNSLEGIKNERELAKKAFVLGIPTAISFDIVKVGDKFGTVYELLDAKSISQLIKENPIDLEKYVKIFSDMLLLVHRTKVKDGDMVSFKDKIGDTWTNFAKPYISKEEFDKLEKLIRDIPDPKTVIHCDYHPNNIMMIGGDPLLIDMDTLSYGHPIFDLANVYFSFVIQSITEPEQAVKFLGFDIDSIKGFWELFSHYYFGTEDKKMLEEKENKVRLVALLRAIRHTARRLENDNDKKRLDYEVLELKKCLSKIDTIDL